MARKSPMKVSIIDRGLNALVARLDLVPKEAGVEIGVIDPKDEETAMLARVHEMGAPDANIPARSFLRSTMAKNRQRYVQLANRAYSKWVDGDWTIQQALNALGEEIRSDVKKTIIKGIPPKLQPATVASKRRRGLPRPRTALYATGKLYEAIKARLVGVV